MDSLALLHKRRWFYGDTWTGISAMCDWGASYTPENTVWQWRNVTCLRCRFLEASRVPMCKSDWARLEAHAL